jgi:uncharacterized membrane protein YuzA (DUF378 family)
MCYKVLVLIGGLNWGLIGLGMLFGQGNWNVVYLILGSVMWLEALVYLLVGVAAVMMMVGCKCKKCKDGCGSGTCSADGKCCADGKCSADGKHGGDGEKTDGNM